MGKMQVSGVLAVTSALLCIHAKVCFHEESLDSDDWRSRWMNRNDGEWKFTTGDLNGDAGLQMSSYAQSYCKEPLSNEENPVLLHFCSCSFSVNYLQKVDCGGGGYVMGFTSHWDKAGMHRGSYYIMFGQDICGYSSKTVYVCFKYKSNRRNIRKKIKCKDDKLTHLHMLILNRDLTYEVEVDNEKVESGSLEDDWENWPLKKIKHPKAKQPEDWDDRAKIDDADDTKPEDWDKPENIPDPDAKKPEDWDEDMDGEWEPPMIPNPEYKGEWKPKQIDNPNYKGPWVHPEIDNPEYSASIYTFDNIESICFNLWQYRPGAIIL